MKVNYHRSFEKSFRKLPVKVQMQFGARLKVFLVNPHEPLLKNHALNGEYAGLRSISVTGDCRAIFRQVSADLVVFVGIGTHAELYG